MSGTTPQALARAARRSSFALGMRMLPAPERAAIHAIYGFCRLVDDIADDPAHPRATRAAALAAWRGDIGALYLGVAAGEAEFLRGAVTRFGLEQADFIAVIDGMQMDVDDDIRWPNYATFDHYCDRVASAVGRLSVRVFGMEDRPGRALAEHLGRALQFTNILRDIDEDAAIGRVYLPLEALTAAGIVPTTPAALLADPRIDAAARWVARRARIHFAEAERILSARPTGRLLAPRLMQVGYQGVLARMERAGWAPPRTRVRTSKLAMIWAALRYGLGR